MSKTKKTTKKAARDPDLVPLTEAMTKPAKPKRPSKTKGAVPAKEKKLSCLDAAAQVLKSKGEPMNCGAMVEAMREKKLWTTDAPTPAATLYSAILREINVKQDASRFRKVDRGQFALND